VTAVDGATARVKVSFPDDDGLLSDWLPVVQPMALGGRCYALPRKGSQVVVLLDEHAEDGVVVGAIYSQADAPPVADPGVIHLELEDGTKFHLEAGKAQLVTPGDATVQAGGTATVKAPAITLDGPVTCTDALSVSKTLTVSQDATIGGKSFLQHKHTSSSPGSPTSVPL
jgi:phage baseplate assembly protein V